MDDNLKLFENPDFGDVRVLLDEKSNPWFVGNDIARCLGYENLWNAVKRFVDDEDSIILTSDCKSMGFKINPLINQAVREIKLINESGMYSLIMSSKMESAKKFKKWVTSEVLPSIRKTGSYSMPSKNELPSDYIEALEALLKSEKEKRALAEAKKRQRKPKGYLIISSKNRFLWLSLLRQPNSPRDRYVDQRGSGKAGGSWV